MFLFRKNKKINFLCISFIFFIITSWIFAGWPQIFNFPPEIQEIFAATETIRPTDTYSQEAWTTPTNGYDTNTNTSASKANINKPPSISFGGNNVAEATNAWQTKSQTWTDATIYLTFSKTAGSNDTVEVLITDQNGVLKHTVVSSTSGAVTKQEFSQALSSADWGGSGFPNIANLRVRVNGHKLGGPDGAIAYMYDIRIDGTYTSSGALTVDIVDSGGSSVASPTMAMTEATFSFNYQTGTGTFGVAAQKIRVQNTTANAKWNLTIAADLGATAFWDGASSDYDFNDPSASAGDGGDADSLGGQMTINASIGTLGGTCSATDITKGSSASFSEGVTDSITLLTAGASADTSCYWDFTGVSISQTIPAEQPADSYTISMTLTATAV